MKFVLVAALLGSVYLATHAAATDDARAVIDANGFIVEKIGSKTTVRASSTSEYTPVEALPAAKNRAGLVKAGTEALYIRTFGKNTQFVWSDIMQVNTVTGKLTQEVKEAYFYEIGMTLDNIGGFDYSTGTFLWASDVVFGKCTEITIPVHGANIRKKSVAPTVQLELSAVAAVATAGPKGGAFIVGSTSKSPEVIYKYTSLGPALTKYALPSGAQGFAPSFNEKSEHFYLLAPVQGQNKTTVNDIDLTASPPTATNFIIDCNNAPGTPSDSFVTPKGTLVVILQKIASTGFEYNIGEVDMSTKKCSHTYKVTTTGLVTASAYSSTKNVVYMGEVTKSGSFLITVDVATGKQSKVNLGGVTVIDMATGY